MQLYLLIALSGYLIGSIPFSYFVGKKTKNLDIRQHGSGNLGATNVIRIAGKKAGFIAFLLDLSKGILAYSVGYYLFGLTGAAISSGFSVIGHSFSIFMKFKGGKGVATTFGILLMFNPVLAIAIFIIQIFIVLITKYMSVGSIFSALLAPLLGYLFNLPTEFLYLSSFLALFVTYRHKDNIKRLLHGNENRFKI
ncbi:MAG: glycerol-3-phosphate 1-O-acyltransferase PlsY [Clostridiales bacterium]|nr:glycerol-3-phosphate 1-O-acyltransferase PlsY [Clostridiales bacterium]